MAEGEAKYYSSYGYEIVELASCKELEESVKLRQDKTLRPITENDILDMIIDLNLVKAKDAAQI